MSNWKKSVLALSLASLIASPLAAQTQNDAKAQAQASATAEAKAVDDSPKVIEEAIAALDETDKAIKALEDGKNDDAVAALERAIGKLEVILTKNPDMTLAPVDVSSTVIDIIASPAEIKTAKAESMRLLADHQLQLARPIISSLASEVDIKTTYIPLGTYPLALKSAAALIKDDKVDEAKVVLGTALGTLVSDVVALPLPILNSVALIDDAKKLSEKADRTEDENTKLMALLDAIDHEIARGEALEYGGKDAFKPLRDEMKEIRKKVGNGGSGKGFFDKLKSLFQGLGKDHAQSAKDAAK